MKLIRLILMVSALVGGMSHTAVAAESTPQTSAGAEQELADRYAPIVYLRQVNSDICNTENEGFDPIAVDFVLRRDNIPLMVSENGRATGRRTLETYGPTTGDLYDRGAGFYLDFPGSPVRPGCRYRRDYSRRVAAEGVAHVAYAHIYLEPESNELALQYWFFYYFNDWNNDHEGDWEMVMLFFDASSAEAALQQEPTRTVYAQHGGGERADWHDDKLSKEDGRPVVYSARGAHASFYEQHVYLGLAENGTGFGCETTKGPHRRLEMDAVVVPHTPTGPDDPFAWLNFTGRWGELRRSEWNGPTGPNAKTSWHSPVTWGDGVRDTSLIVPEFEGFGQAPIDVFCGLVSGGSRALVAFTRTPAVGAGLLGLVLVAAGWVMSYANRSIRSAFAYYRRYFRTFGIIGAALLPTGYVVASIQTLLFRVPPVEPLLDILGRFPGIRILLTLALGSIQAALAVIFVAPAVIWTMSQINAGRRPSVVEAFRNGIQYIVPILIARLHVVVRVLLYAVTIVGLPWAILCIIRAIFLPQAIVIGNDEPHEAIADSAAVVNVDVPRTALIQIVLTLITLLTPPLLAIFLLLAVPSRPLGLVNFVSSALFAFLYPISVIGMTLLYQEHRPLAERTMGPDIHADRLDLGPEPV